MSGQPYENGRVIFRQDDEAPMGDLVWREIRQETGRLFAFLMLGVTLLALVYLLGWR